MASGELDNVGGALGICIDALKVLVNADCVAFLQHLIRLAYNAIYADFLFADYGEKDRQRFVGECLAQKTVKAHVGEVAVDDARNHVMKDRNIYIQNLTENNLRSTIDFVMNEYQMNEGNAKIFVFIVIYPYPCRAQLLSDMIDRLIFFFSY